MIKLIVGTKGSGKTKTLIDMAKAAAETSKGNVVCVEKGDKLAREVPTSVRLINSDEYQVKGFANLYGFLAGILAGNYDITELFIDGILKIVKRTRRKACPFLYFLRKYQSSFALWFCARWQFQHAATLRLTHSLVATSD